MVIHGKRPRSIDANVPDGTVFLDILSLFTNGGVLDNFMDKIESIFQIAQNTFNITFKENEELEVLKERIIESNRNGIVTDKGKVFLTYPKKPFTRVNIRAVPTEVNNEDIIKELEKFKCGKIKRIERIYHRNTKIHNGYRTVFIDEYKERRIPPFVKLGEAFCKVYYPTKEFTVKCNRCLNIDHETKDCKGEVVCLYCKKAGHVQKNCPKKNEDFPVLGRKKINPENLQVANEENLQTEKLVVPCNNKEGESSRKQTNENAGLKNKETNENIEDWFETKRITIEDSSSSSGEQTLTENSAEEEDTNLGNLFETNIKTPISQRVMTPKRIIGTWGKKNIETNTDVTPRWSPSPIAGKRQKNNEESPRKKLKGAELTSDNEN